MTEEKRNPQQWPVEQEQMLLEHWNLGWTSTQSAAVLAKTFGGTWTRNTVVGKRDRMGLKRNNPNVFRGSAFRRAQPNSDSAKKRLARAERLAAQKQSRERQKEIKRLHEIVSAHLDAEKRRPIVAHTTQTRDAIMALKSNSCRYPIGAVGDADFWFCCEDQDAGSSYCAKHRAICTVVLPAIQIRRAA